MKLLKKHTTTKGNKLEFYSLTPKTMFVHDASCLMERTYTIGIKGIISFDDYDTGGTKIENFNQVISSWVGEQIHF
tara:strand:+ start:7816 stop:8043 length:228 start_codon:yes stop_codon:yes gene_type:complete